jgi:hypothetical protein
VEWETILVKETFEKILKLITSKTERTKRLRQSSPFAGILSNIERARICESFAIGACNPIGRHA